MPLENESGEPNKTSEDAGWRELAEAAAGWPKNHAGLNALRPHVNRQLTQRGLDELIVDESGTSTHIDPKAQERERKAGARFLHKFGAVSSVESGLVMDYLRAGGDKIPQKAGDRTAAYLDFMSANVNDGILTGDPESLDRQIETHVIRTEDVPDSYFNLHRRIARERGYGDVKEVAQATKDALIETAQADQRDGLRRWAESLSASDYPDWFKRYAWDSVMKLGAYDKQTGKFDKRDKSTVAPYPELNQKMLAYVYDAVKESHVTNGKVDDPQLAALTKEGSFGRIYAHAIAELSPELSDKGSWVKYEQTTDNNTGKRLSDSLQGHNTGWCTNGVKTATTQLKYGDFYVFYSQDESAGSNTIPRIAIRMEDPGTVAEVCGIEPGQLLESDMLGTTDAKLEDLPGGKDYIQKVADMKEVTRIDNLLAEDPSAALSKEDIIFLYELDRRISSFNTERRDPRVDAIKAKRREHHPDELNNFAVEYLRENFAASVEGYQAVASEIEGAEIVDQQKLGELFDIQLAEWQEKGVMEYIVQRIADKAELHTPFITPNILLYSSQIADTMNRIARKNHQSEWRHADVREGWMPVEVSGQRIEDQPVRFGLMPNKDNLKASSVNDLVQKLSEWKQFTPELGVSSPSLLDVLSHWQTQQAKGEFSTESIPLLDLERPQSNGELMVLEAWIGDTGITVDYFGARGNASARVAVGYGMQLPVEQPPPEKRRHKFKRATKRMVSSLRRSPK